jgi:hypothetical protein
MKKLLLYLLVFASLSGCKKDTDIPDYSTFFGRFNGFIGSISTETPPGIGKASYFFYNSPISPSQSNGGYTSVLTGPNFSISFTKITLTYSGNGAPSASEFQGFFGAGSVPYFDGITPTGISVDYTDMNGITWNSERGDQVGSFFNITDSQPDGNNVKIESEFSCKLFNSNGDSLLLSGGQFTGQFQSQ